jgi:hypothetical protein
VIAGDPAGQHRDVARSRPDGASPGAAAMIAGASPLGDFEADQRLDRLDELLKLTSQ